MKWETVEDEAELSEQAAVRLLDAVVAEPRVVLGLPTGRTPEGMYRHVVEMCRALPRCFEEVQTFNLDEYVGLPASHPGSYRSYMQRLLFDPAGVPRQNTNVPDGMAARVLAQQPGLDLEEALALECLRYEERIGSVGGLGLCFLGLGRNGHIGFNEPGASFRSRTRVVELQPSTRQANEALFAGGIVPRHAITMGIATILESASVVLLASGPAKAEAIARLAGGVVSEDFPASALHLHPEVTVIVDRAAAGRKPQGQRWPAAGERRGARAAASDPSGL